MSRMALERGSLGTKMTGAGWGGCTVSLVEETKAEQFVEAMKKDYYLQKEDLKEKIQKIGLDNIIFVSLPGEGASLVTNIPAKK